MIYFDNSSTSNKKPFGVKLAVLKSLCRKYSANPGRSSHNLSLNAANEIFETRQLANSLFNCGDISHVVFTGGCTEALNIAIYGTVKKGGHVITTSNEHNSVIRPLKDLENKGIISLTVVDTNNKGFVTADMLEKAIVKETYLVVTNHTSNVTGATCNVKEIGKMCKRHKLLYLVDAAQSAGHQKIDMHKDNIDILCAAGHKGLLCMQGVGLLLFKEGVTIEPLKRGGTGTYGEQLLPPNTPPESLEAGTSPTPNIMSLKAGLKYVIKNFDKINRKIHRLTKYLIDELIKFPKVKLYTAPDCYNGVVSFTVKGREPSEITDYLNRKKIYVRSGLHCAPLVHTKMGTVKSGGTIRASLSHYNSKRQIDRFLREIKNICDDVCQ